MCFSHRKVLVVSQTTTKRAHSADQRSLVLTKATLRAGDALGLNGVELAAVLGLSSPTISRMKKGDYALDEGKKEFELAALFVRFFRSLDAIAGGDEAVRKGWMRGENKALGTPPAELIKTVSGLTNGLAYLDARRAPL